MDKVLNDTRNTDVGRVRIDGMAYLIHYKGFTTPTVLDLRDKATKRGFNNYITARMLCPFHLLPMFDNDPETYVYPLNFHKDDFESFPLRFCRDVREGKIAITANDLPSFLYLSPIYTHGASCMDGLLLGDFLVSVPSSSFIFIHSNSPPP